MKTSEIALEYLRVILNWPALISVVVVYFIITQREAITRLIDRIKQVNFPGVGIQTEYNSELPKEKSINLPSSISSGKKDEDWQNKIAILDKDFNNFILLSLQSNKVILKNLLNALWRKPEFGGFGSSPPSDFLKKAQQLSNIAPKAIEDLQYIEETLSKVSKEFSRKDITEAYIKSNIMIDYFRGLLVRR